MYAFKDNTELTKVTPTHSFEFTSAFNGNTVNLINITTTYTFDVYVCI